jgi:hypothetical protein
MLGILMLGVAFCFCYAESLYAQYRYGECLNAECRGAQFMGVTYGQSKIMKNIGKYQISLQLFDKAVNSL